MSKLAVITSMALALNAGNDTSFAEYKYIKPKIKGNFNNGMSRHKAKMKCKIYCKKKK